MSSIACIVLAAGMGTRMKSVRPKVLHRAGGRSLLGHVLASAGELEAQRVCVVHGPGMDVVRAAALQAVPDAGFAEQGERLGTGHAVSKAMPLLKGFAGKVLVLYGDVPLIRTETLRELCEVVTEQAPMAVLGFKATDPHGYGRLITRGTSLLAIREQLDASGEEKEISLCNSGVICIDFGLLGQLLPQIGNDNAKGEYYLTDLVGLCAEAGRTCGYIVCDEDEVHGVNDRVQLAGIEERLQQRYRRDAMRGGATLVAPETVFLSADTVIGRDVVIGPNVVIGPGVTIADEAQILPFCHLEGAAIGKGAVVGPYARLRPAADVQAGAKVGNFVEIKKATVEPGAKVNHLTYIGDARVGEGANVGAGTITCNYDGYFKHFTDIGPGAFIGSNSALVAPVKIGAGAMVGSGSVVTRDVPDDALAIARGKQEERTGWAARFREMMKQKKLKG